ncbi:hypothetical protein CC85DRAFT_330852 [Cutaneotrichosporon oleaginosum]|uniref:Uncharacterized protein n=1 Tax=Cutaneotrichosporon oleaginosum TaxID=879819 RepID=A0A0J0XE69_9TREE|nr:uncharacterized protein CC85DRAFT_330852 [Cutaneotrichosporon oleaginosum]KLT39313.1 hypothetical protein CC85DRAFT_330852 [Cutaneotrichosporon oleaginosum]TXT08570.1 hypothetical protein COLE_05494 [Cutaneotrichosporon oleaginosum]
MWDVILRSWSSLSSWTSVVQDKSEQDNAPPSPSNVACIVNEPPTFTPSQPIPIKKVKGRPAAPLWVDDFEDVFATSPLAARKARVKMIKQIKKEYNERMTRSSARRAGGVGPANAAKAQVSPKPQSSDIPMEPQVRVAGFHLGCSIVAPTTHIATPHLPVVPQELLDNVVAIADSFRDLVLARDRRFETAKSSNLCSAHSKAAQITNVQDTDETHALRKQFLQGKAALEERLRQIKCQLEIINPGHAFEDIEVVERMLADEPDEPTLGIPLVESSEYSESWASLLRLY